jgi:hypothetical protein
MPPVSDKTVKFISKLVKLTQAGKLEWEPERPPRQGAETSFVTEVEGRRLQIYRYSDEIPNPWYMYPNNSIITTSANIFNPSGIFNQGIAAPQDTRQTIIKSGVVLEVFKDNLSVYKFDSISGLSDLYESAAFSGAKVGELMDAILAKE